MRPATAYLIGGVSFVLFKLLEKTGLLEIREARIMAGNEDNLIERITENRQPHFEPYGWHHWPEYPWLAYQFRRGLGETQEGGGTVSECFQAASRMIPGDKESWHREWMRVADRNINVAAARKAPATSAQQ